MSFFLRKPFGFLKQIPLQQQIVKKLADKSDKRMEKKLSKEIHCKIYLRNSENINKKNIIKNIINNR